MATEAYYYLYFGLSACRVLITVYILCALLAGRRLISLAGCCTLLEFAINVGNLVVIVFAFHDWIALQPKMSLENVVLFGLMNAYSLIYWERVYVHYKSIKNTNEGIHETVSD